MIEILAVGALEVAAGFADGVQGSYFLTQDARHTKSYCSMAMAASIVHIVTMLLQRKARSCPQAFVAQACVQGLDLDQSSPSRTHAGQGLGGQVDTLLRIVTESGMLACLLPHLGM